MALPSQTERTGHSARPVMTRSSRTTVPRWAVLGVLALLVGGGLYALIAMLPDKGAPSQADAATKPAADATSRTAANREPTTPPPPRSLIGNTPTSTQTPPRVEPPTTLTQSTTQSTNQAGPGQGGTGQAGTGGPPSGVLGSALDGAPRATDPGSTRPAPVDVTRPDLTAPRPTPAESAAVPSPTTPPAPLTSSTSTSSVRTLIEAGERALASGRLVEARVNLSRAYLSSEIASSDAEMIRQKLTQVNADLVFSPRVTPGDPLAESYTVQSGDVLERVRRRRELTPDWRFIARVNGLANPDRLKVGQKLKLVRGPFHAIVTKRDYRLDLFAGSPDEPENWIYIRSFRVGLGEGNGTPVGTFRIRNRMANPWWVNPRTRERFEADDPKNPIGEHWLGWEGIGDSKIHTGFGLHGTIEPESIGQQRSMGCVRLLAPDIELLYELLGEQVSIVKVVP